jgi:hypothetical protein
LFGTYAQQTILPLAVGGRKFMTNSLLQAKSSDTTISEDLAIITPNPDDNIQKGKLIAQSCNEGDENVIKF